MKRNRITHTWAGVLYICLTPHDIALFSSGLWRRVPRWENESSAVRFPQFFLPRLFPSFFFVFIHKKRTKVAWERGDRRSKQQGPARYPKLFLSLVRLRGKKVCETQSAMCFSADFKVWARTLWLLVRTPTLEKYSTRVAYYLQSYTCIYNSLQESLYKTPCRDSRHKPSECEGVSLSRAAPSFLPTHIQTSTRSGSIYEYSLQHRFCTRKEAETWKMPKNKTL